ncbi:hypothetical protein [Aurantimonas marianensis]|uniref:Uncharacterized protein n=1 Tax=Aurantimonas marianensis TaxID=2920428 RepID=A0A9X2H709_9HYPH|nr:hypothetical protein [Aurantimonas marianensis]MCP3055396.1 hypothetical protein [Aurantimonas marianensis]
MTLKIEVGETRRFLLDRAFYGLSDDRKDRMFARLESDPAVGTPRADRTSLWDWRFGEFEVTYAISDDFGKIVLLELRPYNWNFARIRRNPRGFWTELGTPSTRSTRSSG